MAWVSPLDWTGVVTPSATQMTQQLQGNLLDLYTPPTFGVRRESGQAIPNANDTAVQWDGENWDPDAMHAASSTDVTIGTAGRWMFGATIEFGQSGTGRRNAQVEVASVVLAQRRLPDVSAHMRPALNPVGMEALSVSDVLRVTVRQHSGGNLDVTSNSSMFGIWVGAS